jgi:hypothetical protein
MLRATGAISDDTILTAACAIFANTWYVDLGSTNGSFDERLEPVKELKLASGRSIRIGQHSIVFESEETTRITERPKAMLNKAKPLSAALAVSDPWDKFQSVLTRKEVVGASLLICVAGAWFRGSDEKSILLALGLVVASGFCAVATWLLARLFKRDTTLKTYFLVYLTYYAVSNGIQALITRSTVLHPEGGHLAQFADLPAALLTVLIFAVNLRWIWGVRDRALRVVSTLLGVLMLVGALTLSSQPRWLRLEKSVKLVQPFVRAPEASIVSIDQFSSEMQASLRKMESIAK